MSSVLISQQSVPKHWRNIGPKKRAGVLAPLFCLHSKSSIGVGEIPDLEILAEWCKKTGVSIIQILPLNDVGWDFRPYDSQSAFAIDPMYLRIRSLRYAAIQPFQSELESLEEEFSNVQRFVDFRIKAKKMELLWKIFNHSKTNKKSLSFLAFKKAECSWLSAYAAFKVLKERNQSKPWWEWASHLRSYDPHTIQNELEGDQRTVLFYEWLAWQTATQLQRTVAKIRKKNIFVMADMPFLVSRDSADVWMNPRFFKLNCEAGAPPDLYIAEGQRWGMPPYRWEEIEADGFHYIKERIRFMSRYAHLYRIDHFVGLCRLWTINSSEPKETFGRNGAFDPADESLWKPQGKKIVKAMIEASEMLPCAEDLGVVPDCAHKILNEFQVPGSDVQRWMRHWKGDMHFQSPDEYRPLSMSSLSTHDMPSFPLWWTTEATSDEKQYLALWADAKQPTSEKDFPVFLEHVLEKVLETKSIFSIHVVQDWLALSGEAEFFKLDHRMNAPGTVSDKNWSIRLPFSLEQMLLLPINAKINQLIKSSGRKG